MKNPTFFKQNNQSNQGMAMTKKMFVVAFSVTILSISIFCINAFANKNKSLDGYKNYYLRGVFSVESEIMSGVEQRNKRYFVIYDNKIFTTMNDVSINDNKKVPNGKYTLETDLGTRIEVVVENGEIKDLKSLVEEQMKREKVIDKDNCLTAEFLYNFYILYTGIDGKIFSNKEWSDKRTAIYNIIYEERGYNEFNLYVLDKKIAIIWDGEYGYDEKSIIASNNKNNETDCFKKIDSTHLKIEKDKSNKCFIKTKNCQIIN
jgi:hypothetical protein